MISALQARSEGGRSLWEGAVASVMMADLESGHADRLPSENRGDGDMGGLGCIVLEVGSWPFKARLCPGLNDWPERL